MSDIDQSLPCVLTHLDNPNIANWSENQLFILHLVVQCANADDIKLQILINLFQKSFDQITQIQMSLQFIKLKPKLKKLESKHKNQLKNGQALWQGKQQREHEKIVIKHLIKTLQYKKKKILNTILLELQLTNSIDPELSRLFNLGFNYQFASFLVFVIIKNNQNNIGMLCQKLQISEQKLIQFYEQRTLALKASINEDSNKYSRLFKLSKDQKQIEKLRSGGQMLYFLTTQAIKKYKVIGKAKIKNQQKIIKSLQSYQPKSNGLLLKKQIKQKEQLKLVKIDPEEKNHSIYDSDDQLNKLLNKQNKVKSFFDNSFNQSFFDLQKTYYLQQKGNQRILQEINQQNYADIEVGKSQGLTFSTNVSYVQIKPFNQEKNRDPQFQLINQSTQKSTLQTVREHSYSYQDEAILYLLFKIHGMKGVSCLLAQRILKRKGQQLLQYFISKNILSHAHQLVQSFIKYPQLLQFQKNAYIAVLVKQYEQFRHDLDLSEGSDLNLFDASDRKYAQNFSEYSEDEKFYEQDDQTVSFKQIIGDLIELE